MYEDLGMEEELCLGLSIGRGNRALVKLTGSRGR